MTDSTDNARGPERIWFNDARPSEHRYVSRSQFAGGIEYIRADLAPDPLRAVKVKPLVWDSGPFECKSILGKYHMGRIGCSWWLRLNDQEIDRGTSWSFEGSGEAAKAAAQADYETRIRSALEPCDPLADPRVVALVGALLSIKQYGTDTLSGRSDGPDDRKWQRDGVREMSNRAAAALAALSPTGGNADG